MPIAMTHNQQGQADALFRLLSKDSDGAASMITASGALTTPAALTHPTSLPADSITTGLFTITREMIGGGSKFVLFPFGTDADTETGHWGIILNHAIDNGGTIAQYHRFYAATGGFTLGPQTGVSGGLVTDSHFWADTVTTVLNRMTNTTGAVTLVWSGTADDSSAGIEVDMRNAASVTVELKRNSAASVNAIWAPIGH